MLVAQPSIHLIQSIKAIQYCVLKKRDLFAMNEMGLRFNKIIICFMSSENVRNPTMLCAIILNGPTTYLKYCALKHKLILEYVLILKKKALFLHGERGGLVINASDSGSRGSGFQPHSGQTVLCP